MHAAPPLLLLLPALGGCQYLEEVRTPPDVIAWGGSVLVAQSDPDAAGVLSEGALTLVDLDDTELDQAAQPAAADSPDYWRFEAVPADTEVAIRVESDALHMTPMVWRSRSPSGSAIWLTGAVFAREDTIYDDFFASLDGYQGVTLEPLADGAVAYLWGEPLEPDRWAGVEIVVTDGAGAAAPIWRLAYTDDGALVDAGDGPVDLFVAPNLAPGTVTLTVDGGAETRWPARGGDVLSAIFYDLGAE